MIKIILSLLLPALLITPWTVLIYDSAPELNYWYFIYPLNALLIRFTRNCMIMVYGNEITISANLISMTKQEWEQMENQDGK